MAFFPGPGANIALSGLYGSTGDPKQKTCETNNSWKVYYRAKVANSKILAQQTCKPTKQKAEKWTHIYTATWFSHTHC